MQARSVILFATWSGLVAGSANALGALIRFLAGDVVFEDRPYFWMAPLATMLVFMGLSLPLAGVAAILRNGVPRRLVWWGFAFLALASVLLPSRSLHPVASLVLAAGIAALGTRALASPGGSRRIIVAGLALIVAPAALAAAYLNIPARMDMNRIPPMGAPNVLVLILDTVRADALSVYGAPDNTTPRLDELAREGTLFEWGLAPSSWTLPSHSSFFTGYRPSDLSARWSRRLTDDKPTIAEVLGRAGWRTGGFAANQAYAAWGSGLSRGFDHYWASPLSLGQFKNSVILVRLPLVRKVWELVSRRNVGASFDDLGLRMPFVPPQDLLTAGEITRAFNTWRSRDTTRPFFAFLNLIEAHEEHMVPEHWLKRFNGGATRRDRYNGKVAYQDSIVGALLDTLAVEGAMENTMVIVSSDHGEMFNHNLGSHGNSMYLGVLRVPLIVRFPHRQHAATKVETPVSLRHLPATVLDVVGLPAGSMPGTSWRAWLSGARGNIVLGEVEQAPPPIKAPAFYGPIRSLVDDQWHCIQHADGRMQVYEYRGDPHEENDLASTPRGQQVAARCRDLLRKEPFGYTVVQRDP